MPAHVQTHYRVITCVQGTVILSAWQVYTVHVHVHVHVSVSCLFVHRMCALRDVLSLLRLPPDRVPHD